MKKKRILAAGLAAAVAASFCVSCNGDSGGGNNEKITKTTSDTYPLQTDVTLRIWNSLSPHVAATAESLNDVPLHDFLEEATGIKLQYEHPVVGQEAQSFNILQSSSDVPDIISHGWSGYTGGPQKAIDSKFIISLNGLMDAGITPNFSKLLKEHPEWDAQLKTLNGDYYEFPFIREDDMLCTYQTYVIRQDLLDKAGLEKPETLSEWETVLYKFKEMGLEAPINLRLTNYNLGYQSPFMACFGFAGTFYHDENDKVKFGPYEKEKFTPWVELMKKWYDDGILDKNFVDEDSKRFSALATNGQLGAMMLAIGGEFGNILTAIPEGSDIKFSPTKIPVLNKGETAMWSAKDWPVQDMAAITYDSKNKEIAARFLDFGYSEAGYNIYNFGKEGVSYTVEPNDGTIPDDRATYHKYTPVVTDKDQNGGVSVAQGMAKYIRSCYSGPNVQSVEYLYQFYQRQEQKDAIALWDSDTLKYKLPRMAYTDEEQQKLADIITPIDTYREETLAKIITGKTPISELDNYYSELKRMGIEDAIAIHQTAYDRYLDSLNK